MDVTTPTVMDIARSIDVNVATPRRPTANTPVTSLEHLVSRDCSELSYPGVKATSRTASVQPYDLITDLPNWLSSGTLDAEFKSLPHVFSFSNEAGKCEKVVKKNRNRQIVPYDHNRVILNSAGLCILGENGRDYINASFIRSLPDKAGFIATQGPMLGNVEDFWEMVWAQHTGVIIMLCRLVENCQNQSYKFWPDVGECLDLDDVNLRSEEQDTRNAYVMRKLSLRHSQTGETRAVTLLQFTAWPDSCLPCPSAMLSVWKAYRTLRDATSGPPVVLCSDGSTRCGLFIALDNVASLWERTASVDVVSCVVKAREDRAGMLSSMDQYIYLHTLLVEVFLCKTPTISGEEKLNKHANNRRIDQGSQRNDNESASPSQDGIQEEYKLVTFREPKQKDQDTLFFSPGSGPGDQLESSDSNCSCHRFLYPDDSQDAMVYCVPLEYRSVQRPNEGRLYRMRHSYSLQENKIMLGIPGVLPSHCQSSFLVCQSLTMTHDPDLWQLVFDTGCRTMVKLVNSSRDTKPESWPLYTEHFSVDVASQKRLRGGLQETTLSLRTNIEPWPPFDNDSPSETSIKMFTVPWSHDLNNSNVTPPVDVIVFLFELLNNWLHRTKSTLITIDCGTALDVCVHFCAAFNLLSTMQTDQEAGVGQVLRAVQCPLSRGISQEGYRHLYNLRDHYRL